MSDKISLTCPRCGHNWEMFLRDLQLEQDIYKGRTKPKGVIVKYSTKCPNDGTHLIVEVQED